MNSIGLLGGTSWPSTLEYYRYLNMRVAEHLGGFHSAALTLRNVDYHPIKSLYGTAEAEQEIPRLLLRELLALAESRPCCLLVCNNTLHRYVEMIGEALPKGIPLIHMPEETARAIRRAGFTRVLLTGAKETMENGYYAAKLLAEGVAAVLPDAEDRAAICRIQAELAAGHVTRDLQDAFAGILSRYQDAGAAALACTELPLAVSPAFEASSSIRLFDPMKIQCDAALNVAGMTLR